MKWNLYENEKFLEPLKFSNGKTQEDVVNEVLNLVEKGEKVIFIRGICGTGKCLDKDSLIFCKPKGEKTFSYHKISELTGKEGIIISLDNVGSLRESSFKNVRKTGKKNLFKLKTRTGREIVVSNNHPFLSITNEGIEWKPLKKLDDESYICLPNNICINPALEISNEDIIILAHLIAEGKFGDKGGSPKYYQCPTQNPLIRKDYIDALKAKFPEGEIKEKDCEVSIKFGLMNTTKGTTNKLRLLIQKYGLDGKKSGDKFIPKEIFGLEKDKIALFLSRLFSGDGSIYKRKSGQIVIEYTSISKKLIQDVSILLSFFGIQHTISSKKFKENKEYSFRISISESGNLKKYITKIGFVGRKNILAKKLLEGLKNHKFTNIDKVPRVIKEYLKSLGYNYLELDRFLNYEEIIKKRKEKNFKKIRADKSIKTPFVFNQQKIDFLRSHIEKINGHIKNETLSFISNKDIFWDKIKSIEFEKEDEVYDLEVEENHNFIANGIIVHNSAIALNIARELGKASVVVPGKNLQQQYKKDYEENKYILNDRNEKLKISVITGRNNHKCKFLEDNKNAIPKISKEINSKLHDIFAGKKEELQDTISDDISADNQNIPCKIEIKEKNFNKLKGYLRQNKNVDVRNFTQVSDVKRIPVASVCPYWSPVLPDTYELKNLGEKNKRTYKGLKDKNFIFYQRKPGCPFYEQFNDYIDSDIIVFNSLKYKLESALNRKPSTEVEIIDECDEFLDSFSNQRSVNIERLQNSFSNAIITEEKSFNLVNEVIEILKQLKRDPRIRNAVISNEIIPLKQTGIYDLFKIFLYSSDFMSEIDEESYVYDVEKSAKMFEEFMEESYVTFENREENLIAKIVTTNLAKRFKEMKDKNKIIVLMSGTIHSDEVLRGVFGFDEFKIIDAEIQDQGQIKIERTGLEIDCKYSNFSSGKFTRKDYLKALDKCVEKSVKPTLVHVNSFADLPSENEIREFELNNLMSSESLRNIQNDDKIGSLINDFKLKKTAVLFSTRAGRGIDFPGEECNSIVFTKYPNPNVQDAFWKILNRTNPSHYWSFYKDKARRELLQKIYRGLRFKEDKVFLFSPDLRVLDFFDN